MQFPPICVTLLAVTLIDDCATDKDPTTYRRLVMPWHVKASRFPSKVKPPSPLSVVLPNTKTNSIAPCAISVLRETWTRPPVEGEVVIHNHVYDEGGRMVATSLGGARVQDLDAESAAYIPVSHPPNYRPSDTTIRNLVTLITTICDRQAMLNRRRQQLASRPLPHPSDSKK